MVNLFHSPNSKTPNLFFKNGKPAVFRIVTTGRLALIPILPTGDFYREDLGFFSITLEDLKTVKRNLMERSDLLQIDYNHNAFKPAVADNVIEKRAAGWIDRRSAFICPWNGGYCLMAWGSLTQEASDRRTKGELLYISPALERGKREIGRPGYPPGQEIGLTILNVALCDIPFFDMPPVALFNRRQPWRFGGISMEELKKKIAEIMATLGLAADLIPATVDAIIQELSAAGLIATPPAAPAAAPAPAAPAPAVDPAAAMQQAAAANPALAAVFSALGLIKPQPQFQNPFLQALVKLNSQPAPAPAPAPTPQQNPALAALFQLLGTQPAPAPAPTPQPLGNELLTMFGLDTSKLYAPPPTAPALASNTIVSTLAAKGNKAMMLRQTVDTYLAEQRKTRPTLEYFGAMSELRARGALANLE